ncbi:MAG: O-antigen ligase family protein, partial [bacterium]|nr:O-antigen ligase family protein [bacterium]
HFLHLSVIAGLMSLIYGFLQKGPAVEHIFASGNRLRILGTLGNPAIFAGYQLMTMFFAFALLMRSYKDKMLEQSAYVLTLLLYVWVILIPVFRSASKIGTIPIIGVLLILACLGVFTFKKPSFRKDQVFYIIVIFSNIVAIFSTAVRGTIVALFVGLIVFVIMYFLYGERKSMRNLLVAIIALLIIFEGLLIGFKSKDFVQNNEYFRRLSDISLSSRTIETRIWAWQAGFDGWNDSAKTIVVGWGPENFNTPFSVHFNPKFFSDLGSETLFDRAHNMFVEILATMGIVGFISYVYIFVVSFLLLFKLWKRSETFQERLFISALSAGLISYIVHNLFFFDTSANLLVFFSLMGLLYFLNKEDENNNKTLKLPSAVRVVSVGLVVILVIFSIYFTAFRQMRANYNGTRAVLSALAKDHANAVKMYEDVFALNTFDN